MKRQKGDFFTKSMTKNLLKNGTNITLSFIVYQKRVINVIRIEYFLEYSMLGQISRQKQNKKNKTSRYTLI